ncbi:MAG: helix-turn-helix transcriptional regulator [Rhodobacteraceae bacterium]|nr:helix-turn-helix transcriptional regulator [Paracoccaceae bacterium]
MTRVTASRAAGRRKSAALAAFLLLQAVAAVFFVADAGTDLLSAPTEWHAVLESLVAVVLVAGIGIGSWQLRQTLDRMSEQERALDTARGDLARVIETQFDDWRLTPAERDVGMLALKGLDVAEIASLRSAAQGTVRAQLTRIYAKAGVSGRAQFASWFVEDLLHEGPRA